MDVTSFFSGVAASMENEIVNNNSDDHQNLIPMGFKFIPEDHELIYYLQIKIAGGYIIPNRFYDIDIYNYTPQQLHERFRRDGEDITYFFSPRNRKYPKGKRPDRAVRIEPTKNNPDGKIGFWKASSKDRSVYFRGTKIGTRRNLVYYEGKSKANEKKTNWLMQEFMLVDTEKNNLTTHETMQLDNWVLCKIYHRGSTTPDQRVESQENIEQQNSNVQPRPPSQQLQVQTQPINQNVQYETYPTPISVSNNINTVNPTMPLVTTTGYLNNIGLMHNQFDCSMATMPNLHNNIAAEYNWEAQHQQNAFMQSSLLPPLQQDDSMLWVHNGLMLSLPPSSIQMVEIDDYSIQNSNAQLQLLSQ